MLLTIATDISDHRSGKAPCAIDVADWLTRMSFLKAEQEMDRRDIGPQRRTERDLFVLGQPHAGGTNIGFRLHPLAG